MYMRGYSAAKNVEEYCLVGSVEFFVNEGVHGKNVVLLSCSPVVLVLSVRQFGPFSMQSDGKFWTPFHVKQTSSTI